MASLFLIKVSTCKKFIIKFLLNGCCTAPVNRTLKSFVLFPLILGKRIILCDLISCFCLEICSSWYLVSLWRLDTLLVHIYLLICSGDPQRRWCQLLLKINLFAMIMLPPHVLTLVHYIWHDLGASSVVIILHMFVDMTWVHYIWHQFGFFQLSPLFLFLWKFEST